MEYNSMISAIDNHNIANGDESWFSKRVSNTGEFIGDVGEALTKGSVGAVVAGVDSILNTGIAVANFIGADMAPIDTYNVLKSMDDDLGRYYKEHQEGVEIAGFIATSFIPGMAGVKALQAAKAGYIGKNIAQSSGLMTTLTADYAKLAKIEFASGNSPFSILSANTVKALAQGFGSASLDMIAFETVVTATMYKSPVLDGQSASDVFWNIATGTIVGGGIGGVLHGVKLGYDIKKIGKITDLELFDYKKIGSVPNDATPDIKLINLFQQKFGMPEAELNLQLKTEVDQVTRLKLVSEARDKTLARIDTLTLQTLTDMSNGDAVLSTQLFEVLKNAKSLEDVTGALMHTRALSRITNAESIEFGDVIFPQHKMPIDKFNTFLKDGKNSEFFTPSATTETQGYRAIGDINKLQVANYSKEITNKETAFGKNYDVFRNANGTFSVNPESKILETSNIRRLPNNRIVDFENNGVIVDKATAGLADFATKTNPITVRGNTIFAGELNPIQVGDTLKYNPLNGSHLDAQARTVWALNQKNIIWRDKVIGENDLPLLERAYYDNAKDFSIKMADGTVTTNTTGERLGQFIQAKKYSLAQQANGIPVDEIGYRLNISDKWLHGEEDDLAKLRPGSDYQLPRYGRVDYAPGVNAIETYNTMQLQGAVEYQIQKNLIDTRHKQNFSNFARSATSEFPGDFNWSNPGMTPTREGAGASLLGFANGNYGSAAGKAQVIGIAKNKLELTRMTERAEILKPLMASVVADGRNAATEYAILENTLRESTSANPWVQHPTKPRTLIPRNDFKFVENGGKAPKEIVIENENVWNMRQGMNQIMQENQVHIANLKGSVGVPDNYDPTVWHPIPLDTVKYKHFVIVEPRELHLSDKSRMIVAKDEATLEKMVAQVDKNKFNVFTKTDKEDYHRALAEYEYSLGMNESTVDSTLERMGKMAEFFPNVNPERALQDSFDWHMRQEHILTTRMVYHNYEQSFNELELLGKDYTNLATSQFRSLTEKLTAGSKDPYNEIVKTALDISTGTESRYQWWRSFNETVKDAIETPINKMRAVFRNSDTLDNAATDTINEISDRMGMGRPFQSAYQANVAAGNIADKPWLAKGIAKTQGIMSATLLQLDFMNAANNYISASVLTSAETNNIIRAILAGEEKVAGKLANLTKVKLPDGSGVETFTTAKLMQNAVRNEINDDGTLFARYQKIGAINSDIWNDKRQMLSNLSFDFEKLTPGSLEKKLSDAVKFGRKWTGNELAENTSRFYAADIMRQITDLGIESGVISGVKEANEFIQLFTNRTQGNYLHSQRPIVFQGVVGQAISLFQTYQFNLMQQMFRYVGEGDKKSIAILLGLQNTIYGMQGLPAFNFLNTHIVGNASGNTQHKDLYQASYSVFGKSLGDWILYGAGSNALGLIDPSAKINLYSRGDINPRQLTVLPTTSADIPVVNASVRFVKNLYQLSERVASGGSVWPALSQALEHNGLSRPLAGLAQVAQGYTTTSQASLLTASQDFWNIATLSRISGGKPFDEAISLDALYRINAYKAKDTSNIQELGSAIKTTVIGGGVPSSEQVEKFAAAYAKNGGRIENFNKFFTSTMMGANQAQVNRLAQHLQSPFAKQLQIVMGGTPLPDFINQPATP